MQDSSANLYNGPRSVDYMPYHLGWHDSSSYNDAGIYGDPLASTQDALSYDDTYYLTYEGVDDYQRRSWYKTGRTDRDYKGNEMPHNLSGTCLGDYTCYFGCYWGENEVYPDEGYGSSFDKEESSEDEQYWNCFSYNDYVEPADYSENQWVCYGGVDSGGATTKDDYSASDFSGDWEKMTTLYERIFGH